MILQLSFAIFVVIFFTVALLSLLPQIPKKLWEHPAIFALSFMGVGGVLFFFGSVELVGRYGVSGLVGIAAFGGTFIFSPLFIEPLRWISRSHAFATLPDLLVYRFRNPLVAKSSALLLVVAALPLAAAQFSAFTSLASIPGDIAAAKNPWLTVGMALAACLFIALFGSPRQTVKTLPGIAAFATILALITLYCCGFIAVRSVFGDITELNRWAESSGQDQVIMRFESAYGLILLFLPMAFILPQHSFMQNLSNWWPKHSPSAWMIPCILLVATLPLFPLLWAGLHLAIDVPFQQYVVMLPVVMGAHWLHIFSLVAMLFIGVSFLTVTAISLGKILVTSFLVKPGYYLDKGDHHSNYDLDRWLNRRRFWMASLWLAIAVICANLSRSNSVTDLSITGMIGMIQLLPGIVATLYVPKINDRGFLAGLFVGVSFWLYGVAMSAFFDNAAPTIFGLNVAIGPENWPFWLLESLVANLLTALTVSLLTPMSEEQEQHAFQCMVDNLPTPQRQSLETISLDKVMARLAQWIGAAAAARELKIASSTLSISMDDHRPLALRMLRDRLCFQLSAKLGTLAAENIIDRVMPFGGGASVDDISLLEAQLASSGSALSGLAAELNKLRLYHRQTLENLPIGVCSLDSEGEVLLWNLALCDYTGIEASRVEGGAITDIPAPWGQMLQNFCASEAINWPAHEVEQPQRGVCWYHLSKYRVEENSPVYAGYQVVLMEDVTERLRLVQELAHAERLTSIGRLAAGVAHEIGNPVTGISCLAQDLLAESREQETIKSANIILGLTERISTIVRTLMDFSRSDSQSILKPVALNQALDSAIQLLQLDKGAKTVEFRVTIVEDFTVLGDLHQLTQVFVNLLANARDASDTGGTIEISGELNASINVTRQALLHVTDEGCGIPGEQLDRVMDPFFTTKDPGKGTGLGLSLVYSIMRLHRGNVKITSPVNNGRGTRVTLAFQTP